MRALTAGLTDDSPASLRLGAEVLAMGPAEGSWVQRIAETALVFGQSYATGADRTAPPVHPRPLGVPATVEEPAYATVYRECMFGLKALVAGQVFEAEPIFDHALRLAEMRAGRGSAAAALPAGYLVGIHYEWDEIPRAEALIQDRLAIALETAPAGSLTRFSLSATRLASLRGEAEAAHRLLEQASAVARDRGWLRMLSASEGENVRLLLREGLLPQATRVVQALAQRMPGTPPDPPGTFTETLYNFVAAESRLLMARDCPQEACASLTALAHRLKASGMAYFEARTHILLALAHLRRDAQAEAREALISALTYGQQNGLVRSFIDEGAEIIQLLETLAASPDRTPPALNWYVRDLLAAAGLLPATHPPAKGLQTALSARETEILGCLARGLSNKEIARTLHLAPETVKWHLKNIFIKLNVTSRLQAVRLARSQVSPILPTAQHP